MEGKSNELFREEGGKKKVLPGEHDKTGGHCFRPPGYPLFWPRIVLVLERDDDGETDL